VWLYRRNDLHVDQVGRQRITGDGVFQDLLILQFNRLRNNPGSAGPKRNCASARVTSSGAIVPISNCFLLSPYNLCDVANSLF